jgi:ABC-type nitrate/sulfonate/bicarbonate transport system substrate-binding protein
MIQAGRTKGTHWPFFLLSVAIVVLFIVLTGAASAEKVYLGQSSPGLSSLPVEIGIKRGFYKNEGFDEVFAVSMRSNLLTPALMTGDLDFTLSAGTIINAAATGLPVKIVMSWLDRPYHMLVARPDIKSMTDLKGKKIAVSSFGSTPTWLVLQALAKYNIPENSVTLLTIGGSNERISALAAGAVDAAPMDITFISAWEQHGLNNLLYLGDLMKLSLGGLATSVRKINENPAQVRRMIKATVRSIDFFKKNKPDSVKFMENYLKLTPRAADQVYGFALKSLGDTGKIANDDLARQIRLVKQQLRIDKEVTQTQVADWQFINEIYGAK